MMLKDKKIWSRLFAALLACVLAASLLPAPALAAEADKAAAVTISTGIKERPSAQVKVRWDDAWFAGDASVYRQELALAAMALSGAAYGKTARGPCVQDALKAFGFGSARSYNYQLSPEAGDTAAYTFAVKKVKDQAGRRVQLVAIVTRGTGSYMEWASNLNVGSGSSHQGFVKARDELLENLEGYLSKAGVSGKGAAKFLVTGHSRGGAAANLVSAHLVEAGLAEKEDVYGYTFAAPAVSTQGTDKGYENIFNIVNPEDLVTLVPLSAWGYRRYGVDLPLPSEDACGDAWDGIFADMDRQYTALTGQPYARFQTPGAVQEMTEALHRLIPETDGANMAMLSAMLRGDLDGLSQLVDRDSRAALALSRTALELSAQLSPLLQLEREAMVSAHCMAGYWCWLSASELPLAGKA